MGSLEEFIHRHQMVDMQSICQPASSAIEWTAVQPDSRIQTPSQEIIAKAVIDSTAGVGLVGRLPGTDNSEKLSQSAAGAPSSLSSCKCLSLSSQPPASDILSWLASSDSHESSLALHYLASTGNRSLLRSLQCYLLTAASEEAMGVEKWSIVRERLNMALALQQQQKQQHAEEVRAALSLSDHPVQAMFEAQPLLPRQLQMLPDAQPPTQRVMRKRLMESADELEGMQATQACKHTSGQQVSRGGNGWRRVEATFLSDLVRGSSCSGACRQPSTVPPVAGVLSPQQPAEGRGCLAMKAPTCATRCKTSHILTGPSDGATALVTPRPGSLWHAAASGHGALSEPKHAAATAAAASLRHSLVVACDHDAHRIASKHRHTCSSVPFSLVNPTMTPAPSCRCVLPGNHPNATASTLNSASTTRSASGDARAIPAESSGWWKSQVQQVQAGFAAPGNGSITHSLPLHPAPESMLHVHVKRPLHHATRPAGRTSRREVVSRHELMPTGRMGGRRGTVSEGEESRRMRKRAKGTTTEPRKESVVKRSERQSLMLFGVELSKEYMMLVCHVEYSS